MDRRKTTRYPVRAPVLFKWTDADGASLQDGGFTRDASTGGLFVCSEHPPPLKSAVSIEVLLPLFDAPSPGLRLSGQGVVVRVEERESPRGFAVKTHLDLDDGETDSN